MVPEWDHLGATGSLLPVRLAAGHSDQLDVIAQCGSHWRIKPPVAPKAAVAPKTAGENSANKMVLTSLSNCIAARGGILGSLQIKRQQNAQRHQ
jgi:hypothetical protein